MDVRSLTAHPVHNPIQSTSDNSQDESDMDVDSATGSSPNPPRSTNAFANAAAQQHKGILDTRATTSDASAIGSPAPSDTPATQQRPSQPQSHSQSMDVSSEDEDADASDDDDEPPRLPTSRRKPAAGDKIDLANADPELYGLRRSVSTLHFGWWYAVLGYFCFSPLPRSGFHFSFPAPGAFFRTPHLDSLARISFDHADLFVLLIVRAGVASP